MEKPNLKAGDPVLITGPKFFEKATVVSVKNGTLTLNNNMVVSEDLRVVLNNPKSRMEIKKFDEQEYNFLVAKSNFNRVLERINLLQYKLSQEDLIKLFDRLNKIEQKFQALWDFLDIGGIGLGSITLYSDSFWNSQVFLVW